MSIVTATNFSAGDIMKYPSADTDPYDRATQLAAVTKNLDTHDHSSGLGLGVARVQTSAAPSAAGGVQATGDAFKWWGATAAAVRTAVDVESTQTISGAKTFSGSATIANGLTVTTGGLLVNAGNVGIGGAPATKFHVYGQTRSSDTTAGNGTTVLGVWTNDADADLRVLITQVGAASKSASLGPSISVPLVLLTGNAERLRIDALGNVGINTTVPDREGYGSNYRKLSIEGNSTFRGILSLGRSGSADATTGVFGDISFFDLNGGNSVGSRAQILADIDGATNSSRLSFWTGTSANNPLERLRIDSAGNLIQAGGSYSIGSNPATTGTQRFANNASAYYRFNNGIADVDQRIWLSSGASLTLGDPGNSSSVTLTGQSVFLQPPNGTYNARMVNGEFSPTDNNVSLGASGRRWTAVYAVNGTIQTSHSSAKNFLGAVDPAAALAVARETTYHRFTYKGDREDTRLRDYRHVGIKAETAHEWLSPDGETVNPQTTASIALAAVAGEADAREADVAALRADVERLKEELAGLRN